MLKKIFIGILVAFVILSSASLRFGIGITPRWIDIVFIVICISLLIAISVEKKVSQKSERTEAKNKDKKGAGSNKP